MTDKLTDSKEARVEVARVLHKALRQFELEHCPEAFDMKVHIDQILAKLQPLLEQARKELLDFQVKALRGDYQDAVDCQHIYDNNPNWTEKMKDEHNNYWRGQAGALAKILDAVEALQV